MKQSIAFSILVTSLFGGAVSSRAETFTNCVLPGITCWSETRTNPPERLFIAEVDLKNPHLHLRVAPGGADPDGSGPWNTTLREPTRIADRENFSFVVNGDFFLVKNILDGEGINSHYHANQWARPEGPAMSDGKTWSTSTNSRPCFVIHKDGGITIESLASPGTDDWQVIGGGPVLLRQGAVTAAATGTALPHKGSAYNPRTVVGLDAAGTKLTLLVVDGRKPGIARGMTYPELAAEMRRLGCTEALNLDGGGSSLMAVRDSATGSMRILNQPTDSHERPVADVLGIVLDR